VNSWQRVDSSVDMEDTKDACYCDDSRSDGAEFLCPKALNFDIVDSEKPSGISGVVSNGELS
jgi:hypothetical protein